MSSATPKRSKKLWCYFPRAAEERIGGQTFGPAPPAPAPLAQVAGEFAGLVDLESGCPRAPYFASVGAKKTTQYNYLDLFSIDGCQFLVSFVVFFV